MCALCVYVCPLSIPLFRCVRVCVKCCYVCMLLAIVRRTVNSQQISFLFDWQQCAQPLKRFEITSAAQSYQRIFGVFECFFLYFSVAVFAITYFKLFSISIREFLEIILQCDIATFLHFNYSNRIIYIGFVRHTWEKYSDAFLVMIYWENIDEFHKWIEW